MSAFDWPALMRAGFRGLSLHPDAFWRLTPNELLMMLGEGSAIAPVTRVRLHALSEAFPDKEVGANDD